MLDVNLTVDEDVKFVRRLNKGEGNTSSGPRPLAVYLRKKADRDLVLATAYKLDKCQDQNWKAVNIVADLTYQQRKYEASLKTESQSKNLKRSEEEVRDKQVWKVIGKRGARRLQLVVLREGEMVDKSGNVVEVMEDDQERDNRKRRNSAVGAAAVLRIPGERGGGWWQETLGGQWSRWTV